MLAREAEARGDTLSGGKSLDPLAPRPAMFGTRAKSVIFLFMYGGPSHVDTFDPKVDLEKFDGKTMRAAIANAGEVKTFGGGNNAPLMRSPYKFQKYGKSGIEVSRKSPKLAAAWTTSASFGRSTATATTTPPRSSR